MTRRLAIITFVIGFVACASQASAADAPRIRVLTYNIHHGEGTDGKFDLERIAKVILSVKPDIVALQEVDQKTGRASGVDQAAELGRLTGMHQVFGKAMDFSGGGYGEAILSRWKFENTKNHLLPASPGFEPRSAIAATVRINDTGPRFTFVGTHLDHTRDPKERIAQVKEIIRVFEPNDEPVILAGDLNATPGKDEIKLLLEKWTSAAGDNGQPTYPSDKPSVQIDYVMFRPAKRWKVIEVKVIEEKIASDHRPLLVVLEYVEDAK
ncbi:MAG: endonuclease/exonuclease/phosphatase family protein [Phycisphaeraceae bacterium]